MRKIPYYPSRYDVIRELLKFYVPKSGERILELGSGDARFIRSIAKLYDDIHAVGVEINQELVNEARRRVLREGLDDRVTIVRGDLFKYPIDNSDTIYVYLTRDALARLKQKFEKFLMKDGKIISLDFGVPGLRPSYVLKIDTPYIKHKLYFYWRNTSIHP